MAQLTTSGRAPVLTFLGGTGTVTGSKFLVDGGGARLLVDAGLYQGERRWRRLNWEPPPLEPGTIDAVALSHAHLDHCGYLPALVRGGFTGPVFATSGTAQLAAIVLRDSAHLQEEEAVSARSGGWSRHDPPLPLYTAEDAERAIALFRACAYGEEIAVGEASVRFARAGHILGSASTLVRIGEASALISGDLGRSRHPLLLSRDRPPAARTVVIESTYGDRQHPDEPGDHSLMADAIRRTIKRGGSVVIPAFAVDRTEIVLLALADLQERGEIPDVPVYVDSPMALATLDVYRDPVHEQEIQVGAIERITRIGDLRTAHTAEESMRLNNPGRPSIIVSASGMATGGRVVHHLKHLLPQARNTVVLTGYQAAGTRGRALQDGEREIKISGRYVRVRAEIVSDDSFSVHADADELVAWLDELPEPPESVYVVHGEPDAAEALAARLRAEADYPVVVPRLGERVLLD
ncbi:beta-lactamase [Intrasporangium oryzae NRRL B-24470]|uniref:Beta-lactamase n=1 Tax=Intrasporangium oryzae NRRL B-24470 TaxID=1386089 RepID=W9G3P7_9MICO|nr:MBL fold metallo-hydrolase [Intrasporangium oryzae]EWT00766.1 beta-lactamase [Intrasporangium oryzae NRRL B-24470]